MKRSGLCSLWSWAQRVNQPFSFYGHRIVCFSTKPPFTKDHYNVKRGSYAALSDKDVNFFESILGKTRVLTESSDVDAYNIDWLNSVRGQSQCILKPKTTEEVSAILNYCNALRIAVCPQGGNTGLVGGSVPVFDEVILSTSLMNEIISMDYDSGVLVCQAGCVLERLESFTQDHGFTMPLDLGAKGSCQIGGNVSTNAGGLRLVRYGSLHGSVLGVEAVLANGEVVNCLSGLKKDNTGYHLKHLFIGSEGTLGIVTKVAIQCPPSPKANTVAFLGLDSFKNVLETFKASRRDVGEILSSCEMMDQDSLRAVQDNLKLRIPVGEFPFYMLLETAGSNSEHDQEKISTFLENLLERGVVLDCTLATQPSHIKDMWQTRERITEGLTKDGYVFKYDISLPHRSFYDIVVDVRERLALAEYKRVSGYGHVGDGNLHLNVTSKKFDPQLLALIEPFVFEYVAKLGGSISAEHGIGFKKSQFIHLSKSSEALRLMQKIKDLMDPNGILNPYKVLPQGNN